MEHTFKKKFGQNFLRNTNFIIELITSAGISQVDNVLEIGPGDGAVTEFLVNSAKKLTVVEIDTDLIPKLKQRFSDYEQFELINSDILQLDPTNLFNGEPYKIIGSLPYNISKKIINKFLKHKNPPQVMSVIIQKEVARDYVAAPPKASFLGMAAQIYADISYIATIPKEQFYPTPLVDGGILRFDNINPKIDNPEELIRFIKTGFSSPRKKLSRNLSNVGYEKTTIEDIIEKSGLTKTARASELNLEQWIGLKKELDDQAT